MSDDKKNPKEASNIFHSIMKASVKPLKPTDSEIIDAVKNKFNATIEKRNDVFIFVDNDINPKHELAKEINEYIHHIIKNGL